MNTHKHVSLNMSVRGLEQSATLAINELSKQRQMAGKEVFRFGLGQSPFPVPAPVVASLREHAHEKDYLPSRGHPALQEAVSEYHRRLDGVESNPRNVLIGPGSKELMFLLQLVYYGELMVPTPCWVSYTPQARILGRHVSLIHTSYDSQWRVTAEQLEKHCAREEDDFRPRILVLNYPGNPEGCTYERDDLKDLAEVARRFQVIVLSDEIYGQLHHRGQHVSIARYYPEGTILSSGLSKWCGAGGWRLGTFTFPNELDWLAESMAAVASETFTSVSAPIQCAAIRAFRGGTAIERYLWHSRRILAELGRRIVQTLRDAGARIHDPSGGFYLFPDFEDLRVSLAARGITNSGQLCDRLLDETGVAILPGQAFERPLGELTARLAYVDFDGAKALTASETIPLDHPLPDDFVDTWCTRSIKAAQLMADWLRG